MSDMATSVPLPKGYCRNCGTALTEETARDVRGILYCEPCLAAMVAQPKSAEERKSPGLAAVLGAIPGALPPVTGWVAARGDFGPGAWVLFAILFLWQLPHSLAIGWLYRADYARAGIRLLPVIEPDGCSTVRQIVSNCLALLAVGLLPTLIGLTGSVYFLGALALGTGFLVCGIVLAVSRSAADARRLVFASLVYLPALLVLMALNKVPF